MQQEENQNSRQLLQAQQDLMVLNQLKDKPRTPKVELGSLLTTDNGNIYYLSIGIGKLIVNGQKIFVISPESPIGKCLLFQEMGNTIVFNERRQTIQSIL